jgi:hypothetical protein
MSQLAMRINERNLHLLREIAAGKDRIFALDDRPPGAGLLMQVGYITRVGKERAMLTPEGRAFLAGIDYVLDKL